MTVQASPGNLPQETVNGRARALTLAHRADLHPMDVVTVDYQSRGNLLLVGSAARALACAQQLGDRLRCVILTPDRGGVEAGDATEATVVHGSLERLRGHLGRFSATVVVDGRSFNPAHLCPGAPEFFDLVLDLGARRAIASDIPPLGYFAPVSEAELQHALGELPELVGAFEKPRYFHYDPDICAHGRSGLEGCRRCIDACPTEAISSLKERIEVDPYLCQGGGSCATACPSGAITYAYPPAADLIDAVRASLRDYRSNGGHEPQVLFTDAGPGAEAFASLAERIPENVLPFQVEELGSVGMEVWLAAIAFGARRVVLLATPSVPCSVLRELSLQISYAGGVLEGMGYPRSLLQLVFADGDGTSAAQALSAPIDPVVIEPAEFAGLGQKRAALRMALDHLYVHAPEPQAVVELPDGAPFGAIDVNTQTCTLCMACVSVCPASALYDGDERPQLRFVEGNCVQCGLCHAACPEDAIRLLPRIAYESRVYREQRVLHEEEPFCCVSCGKPFATQAIMRRMTEKLSGHWMFKDPAALRRIQMCEQCRVVDMFSDSGGGPT